MITPEITTAAGAASVQDQRPETGDQRPDDADAQAASALRNVGDTVRASWRFSLDNVRTNIAYMRPEAKELLIWAFQWCIDPAHPVRFDEFCTAMEYAGNTVWKMYSGKYKHPETEQLMDAPEKLLKNIRAFRRLELQRAKLGASAFVWIPTAKKIRWACDQARKSNTPVIVYGASQIGKTEAFRQYCMENNHGKSVHVELEAVNGLKGLLQAIAVKLGISPKANTPDLIERIKKALTRDMVLILDEVHLLANVYRKGSFFACMEQIRRIYDSTQVGLVMSFTLLTYSDIEKAKKTELEQVFRRGVHRVNLGDRPLSEDVKMIAEDRGLSWAERHTEIAVTAKITDSPWKVLKQLAYEQGLKAITERIRLANELAADAGREEVTWADFLKAHYAIQRNAEQPKHGWDEREAA